MNFLNFLNEYSKKILKEISKVFWSTERIAEDITEKKWSQLAKNIPNCRKKNIKNAQGIPPLLIEPKKIQMEFLKKIQKSCLDVW